MVPRRGRATLGGRAHVRRLAAADRLRRRRGVPNDVVVADDDGAVLVPQALLDDVLAAAVEQERLEGWIMAEVERGASLPGLYPPNAENAARYEAWRRGKGGG